MGAGTRWRAGTARWSEDGRWLYFLSSRSGSTQLWRTLATGMQTRQVTNLPLDVAFYRLAPDGRTLVAASGVLYDSTTTRYWDTYLDGRFIGLFAINIGAATAPTDAVALTRGFNADIVAKPEGDDSSFVITRDGRAVLLHISASFIGLGLLSHRRPQYDSSQTVSPSNERSRINITRVGA